MQELNWLKVGGLGSQLRATPLESRIFIPTICCPPILVVWWEVC